MRGRIPFFAVISLLQVITQCPRAFDGDIYQQINSLVESATLLVSLFVYIISKKYPGILNYCGELVMACMLVLYTVLFVAQADKAFDPTNLKK